MLQQIKTFLANLRHLASVSLRIDDGPQDTGWTPATVQVPHHLDYWPERHTDLADILEAWRRNFLIRQITRLTTAYTVGDGFTLTSEIPAVDDLIQQLWTGSNMARRIYAWSDELVRAGEIFPILFTLPTGQSQVREIPASRITRADFDPDDYERELVYYEQRGLEEVPWASPLTAALVLGSPVTIQPAMLHFSINKPLGAWRGESDLLPVIPHARRYTEWLRDRAQLNKMRTELAAVLVEIADANQVEKRQKFYRDNPPKRSSIIVAGPGEKISFPTAQLGAHDASPDGRALRLAVCAGANIPLHFIAEGSSATRSTAQEMGDPTHRGYRIRQGEITQMLISLATHAWRRFEILTNLTPIPNPQIKATVTDISRADNETLAAAMKTIVDCFALMKANNWITDRKAVELSFKFAGETLTETEIEEILDSPDLAPEPDLQSPGDALAASLATLSADELAQLAQNIGPTPLVEMLKE